MVSVFSSMRVNTESQESSDGFITNHLDPMCGGILWSTINSKAPKRMTHGLLSQLRSVQLGLLKDCSIGKAINYHVISSDIPDVFSLGGDLDYFSKCVQEGNKEGLIDYAKKSVDLVYTTSTNYHLPITTITVVQGLALGGGFEAALSANYLIAEKQATFSFPETRFGLFPGMGAYTFLRQRVSSHLAEEIIYSGREYSAQELYKMKVVDRLCETGQGIKTTLQFIQKRQHQHQGIQAMREMVQKYDSVDKGELDNIVEHWVDCVMSLESKQIRLISALSRTR